MKVDLTEVFIKLESDEMALGVDNDYLEGFEQKIHGKIYHKHCGDDDVEQNVEIGYFNYSVFNLPSFNENTVSPDYLSIFDGISAELGEYCMDLFEDSYSLKESILEDSHDVYGDYIIETGDVRLILAKEIQIKDEYRGQDIGMMVTKMIWELFRGTHGIFTCKPFPIQFSGQYDKHDGVSFDKFVLNEKEAKKKITKHWGKMGLKKVGKHGLYYSINPKF